jgi:hypothetical protein
VPCFSLRLANTRIHFRQLHSLRPALTDVPAVYLVSPTLPNVRRIAEDLEKSLYESYHLNFVEPLPRSLLEELAAAVARDGTGESVDQVRRHTSDFSSDPTPCARYSTNTCPSLPHLRLYSLSSLHHRIPPLRHSRYRRRQRPTRPISFSTLPHQQSNR